MTGSSRPTLSHRPALDGLRGVAVVLVVAYHLGGPVGGYLGVDVFFVLSGYLITSLLLLEHEATGRIDLAGFYDRRIRRLLPALLVVLGLVVLVTPAPGGLPVRGDALSTLLYVANWRFIATASSYFADLATASPLRHAWSLAIEEQFYLVWPLLFAGLMRRWGRLTLGVVTAIAVVASVVAMAVLAGPGDPSRAYYGTGTRAHQLLVGVLVAVLLRSSASDAARRWTARLARLAVAAIPVGLAAVVWLEDTAPLYYRGGSLVVALVVALTIVAVEAVPAGRLARALSWRPLTATGLVSYGLYLWHWPALVAVEEAGITGATRIVLVLAVTVAGALGSYVVVERPLRRGVTLGWRLTPGRTAVAAPAAMALVAALVVGRSAALPTDFWMVQPSGGGAVVATAGDVATVGVVGDSVAASLVPGLQEAAAAGGWGVASAAARGCPALGGYPLDRRGQPYDYSARCAEHVPAAYRTLVEEHAPPVVLWLSAAEAVVRVRDDAGQLLEPGTDGHDRWIAAGLERVHDELTAGGAVLVIVRPLPPDDDPCRLDPGGGRCEGRRLLAAARDHLGELLEGFAAQHDDVRLLDLRDVVCGADDVRCPRVQGGVTLRPDGNHFSDVTAAMVAPDVLDRVFQAALRAGAALPTASS